MVTIDRRLTDLETRAGGTEPMTIELLKAEPGTPWNAGKVVHVFEGPTAAEAAGKLANWYRTEANDGDD